MSVREYLESRPGRSCVGAVVKLEVSVGDLSFPSELRSASSLRFVGGNPRRNMIDKSQRYLNSFQLGGCPDKMNVRRVTCDM